MPIANTGNHARNEPERDPEFNRSAHLPRTEEERKLLRELDAADFASLGSRADSNAACDFTTYLTDIIATWELQSGKRKHQRVKSIENIQVAVEGFVGDLLLAFGGRSAGWVYRSVRPTSFSGERVSARAFETVLEGLKANELVEHRPGSQYYADFGDGARVVSRTRASRFRATQKFLTFAAERGITPASAPSHFTPGLPQHPLVLKATATRASGAKENGKRMKFPSTLHAVELEGQIQKLNEFLDKLTVRRGTHRGFVRIFNNGDDPAFNWNMGGRLYSEGKDSYQMLSEEERLNMTIDGEAVCEIDIRASYLTILHARHDIPFAVSNNNDPYNIPGVDRFVVKNWIVIFLGSKKFPTRWPPKARKDYTDLRDGRNLSKDFPIKLIGKMVVDKFPLLGRWSDLPDTWATLMYQESEAILTTMIDLMTRDIPSLPVHDSIIVPASKENVAYELLGNHYREVCGVVPALVVHRSSSKPIISGTKSVEGAKGY